MIHLFYSK